MTLRYLGIDPGLHSTGWAYLDSAGVRFGVVRVPRNLLGRIHYVLNSLPVARHDVDVVRIERMIYRGANAKGSLQGLLDLQLLAGAIGGRYGVCCDVDWVAPHEWKGTLPAQVLLDRLLSEQSHVLTHAQKIELDSLPGKLDAAAAIGIVRFAAGLPLT